MEQPASDYDREKLQKRLTKLVGGAAIIKVGGGVALLRASKALDGLKVSGDGATGVDIVRRAPEEPCWPPRR